VNDATHGTPNPAAHDRRLLAVLCADLAGYSRLMRADEEGTFAELQGHLDALVRPALARHNGRLVKTAGDGLLATFDSPVGATRCALEIQDGMASRTAAATPERRQAFRIGLHLGDVIVTPDDVFGDAVNLAARLQALAEPGTVYLSATVHEQVRDHLDRPCRDLGEHKLKNLDRPARIYRLGDGAAAPRRRWWIAAAAMLLLGLIGGGALWWPGGTPPATRSAEIAMRPGIAVLPFANRGEQTQEYFSDGITEDLIAALGRFPGLTVMGRNAVLPYKDKPVKAAEVGRDLNVRYIVEGSVWRVGDRLRVTAQLTDTGAGKLLWSEQFDEQLREVFAVQDSIVRRVAGTLAANVERLEQRRAAKQPTENLDAYDLVLRAQERLHRVSRADNRQARQMLERAIELDPNYAAAYVGLAVAHLYVFQFGWSEFPDQTAARAEAFAQKAVALDDSNADAHRVLSAVHNARFEHDRALSAAERAIALNPSSADSRANHGLVLLYAGRAAEAIQEFETARRIDPGMRSEHWLMLAIAYLVERRLDEALKVSTEGASRFPANPYFDVAIAATRGHIAQDEATRRAAEQVRRRIPNLDFDVFGSALRDPGQRQYLTDGLRKAGLQ